MLTAMSDTQWPRYIVFQQDEQGAPYHYDGSVHAPDAELALLNARDVFTRRPACTGLWVVHADRIFARTVEELAADPGLSAGSADSGSREPYSVFQKHDHKGVHSFVGEVEADSPVEAMRAALMAYPDENAIVWWVCPSKAIARSSRDDVDGLFQMSDSPRFYREQAEFKTLSALRKQQATPGEKTVDAG
jgi:ring-1,2-phenylacetyl-CoA epoxidase subunit PaaB